MGELVNLRTMRKRVKRQHDEQRSDVNRLLHGQPNSARKLEEATRNKAARELDQHRIDTGDGQ
jgi:hypothetical protein